MGMRKHVGEVALAIAVGLGTLSACSDDLNGSARIVNPTVNAVAGHWALSSATIDGTTYSFPGGLNGPTFHVRKRDGRGQGNVGCSIVGFRVLVDGSSFTLSVSGVGSMLSCMFEEEDKTEGRYFEALHVIDRAELSTEGLTLIGPAVDLHFVRIRVD